VDPEYAAVLSLLRIEDAAVRACVRCGSRVYGTAHAGSDRDFLVVLRDPSARQDLRWGAGINVVVHGERSYELALANQSVFALEALFAPAEHQLKAPVPPFTYAFDRARLAASATERADADWNKAKKTFADEPAAARKRVSHALRVLTFAAQVAKDGRIVDYRAPLAWREQLAECMEWAAVEAAFGPTRDALAATLRAPHRKRR
jgi:hypothetical protein